jgi:hypothetical protein
VDVGRQLALGRDRTKRRMLMFSPILPTSAVRVDSTVPPPIGRADKAATSAGFFSATSRAQSAASLRNSSFLATKSVSLLISKMLPSLPSAAMWIATTPSAATRVAALLALLPSLTRRISSAFAMSPAASVSAFLHSIIGASVFSRSSLTMLAVISAILLLQNQILSPQKHRGTEQRRTPSVSCASVSRLYSAASSTSTNSSSPASCWTTSLMPWLLPSRIASATPRA